MKTNTRKTVTYSPAQLREIMQREYFSIRADLTYPASAALHYAKQWAEIQALEQKYEIELEAEFDDQPIRGNAIATGDDEEDTKVENKLIERCNRGDVWAWAQVTVRVTHAGITEEDYLGGCSYKDATDFKKGGYYFDMVTECVERILAQLDDDQSGEH